VSSRRASLVLAVLALTAAGRVKGQVQLYSQPGNANQPANTSGLTATWQFQNTGSTQQTLNLTCYASGPVTSCSVSSPQPLPGYGVIPVNVTFSTGAPGTGYLRLVASCASSCSISPNGYYDGTVTETVIVQYQDSVTPKGTTTLTRIAGTGPYAALFTIKNTGYYTDTYSVTCSTSGPVTCTRVSAASVTVAGQGASQTDTAYYNATGPAGNGTLSLKANGHGPLPDSGTFNVPVINRANAVRAELSERQQFMLTRVSHRFFVKNLQPQTATYNLDATCSGTATSCPVTPTSMTLAFGENQVATVSDSAPTAGAGSVMLRAIDASVSAARDSTTVALTAVSAPAPVVSLVSTNPGTTVERDLCLTIAAGSHAAFECGDLRIVHALPAIRTLNKARVPTLLYNSAYAQPTPVFTAQVTVNTVPDSVEGILKIGGVEMARARWAGSDWSAGSTRQIALAYTSPDTISNGVYDYTFDVATVYLPSGYYLTSTPGKFILVNRAKSPFGAGWGLAGLERLTALPDSSRLWIGGDGSTRLYTSAGSNVWVASNLDRPDTLTRTGSRYSRRLPGGVMVGFNAAGLHDSTVNRLGHATGFSYDTVAGIVRLRTIALPSQGGRQLYTFNYDSNNKLSNVAAPGGRTTTVSVSAERVDSIRDADGVATKFAYFSSKLIMARTDRRGTVTSYSYDVAQKLWRVQVNLQPDSIRTGFRARDVIGLATASPKTATDTANVYTSYFGARNFATGNNYVAQETKFWLDRYGAPRQIVNPLGYQTIVRREEGQWAGLATEQQAPNGFLTRGRYDGRGNIVASMAVAPLGPGTDDTTRYHWDPLWDFVDSIVTPMGVTTTMAYDGQNGNRLWQQVGSDPGRRVNFGYGNTPKLLSSTVLPQTPADSIVYDGQWNVTATRTPKGFWTSYYKDALGRDTLVVTPIDSTDTSRGGAADSTTRLRQRVVFTVMDRDSIAQTIAPNRAQTITVNTSYDSAGNKVSLSRISAPDPDAIGSITTRWRYDRANRPVAEVAPDGQVDSTSYDPAGNAVTTVTRRTDPVSHVRLSLTMQYDALNRLIQRAVPHVSYPRDSVGIATLSSRSTLNHGYPYYSNDTTTGGYTIVGDTVTFAYDAVGRDTLGNNRDAQVRRFYYSNGALQAESLKIRTLAEIAAGGSFDLHKYGITYRYDRDGRRTVIKYPAQLAPAGQDSARFGYDASTGALTGVWDLLGNNFVYQYNLRGERDTLTYAPSPFEAWTYNADGALVHDFISGTPANPPHKRDTVLRYDARQKVLFAGDSASTSVKDTLFAAYDGLGHLLSSKLTGWGQNLDDQSDSVYNATYDTLSNDALGNLIRTSHAMNTTAQNGGIWLGGSGENQSSGSRNNVYQAGTGRLVTVADNAQVVRDTVVYDSAGNTHGTWGVAWSQITTGLQDRLSYYAADGLVRAADYRTADGNPTGSGAIRFVFEEYRYDAYGRRVWVRARRACADVPDSDSRVRGECQLNHVRRTVWDGSQELAEIQQPGGDTDPMENDTTPFHRPAPSDGIDENPFDGRVLYTYGTVVDQPLSVTRLAYADSTASTLPQTPQPWIEWQPFTLLPLWSYLGEVERGMFGAGALPCQTVNSVQRCVIGAWPFGWNALHLKAFTPYFWDGTVTEGKRDKAQTLYRRNRVYDPATGRFTQEDPLGLAGGLNLYGFAAGDPVNFSDPFGLQGCPKVGPPPPECEALVNESAATFFTLWGGFGAAKGLVRAGLRALGAAFVEKEATSGAVSASQAIARGLVKSEGKLASVLRGIEGEFGAAQPKSAMDALEVVGKATAKLGLEPGVATVQESGAIVLQNVGGVTTTIGTSGEILVQRGSDILLRLIPK
jgi:RHS repeat-associated protein